MVEMHVSYYLGMIFTYTPTMLINFKMEKLSSPPAFDINVATFCFLGHAGWPHYSPIVYDNNVFFTTDPRTEIDGENLNDLIAAVESKYSSDVSSYKVIQLIII